MIELLVSSINLTGTCVPCPCEPVLPSTVVTLASLMNCNALQGKARRFDLTAEKAEMDNVVLDFLK